MTDSQRPTTPEEKYLEKKRAELAVLESQLAERELELHTLRGGLLMFEKRYQAVVSEKYAELDEFGARIAELLARHAPRDDPAQKKAIEQRERAEKSARTARKFKPPPAPSSAQAGKRPPRPPPAAQAFNPAETLKRLYREVAKAIHPDLADDDAERANRHAFMIRANEAYEAGSEKKLLAIFQEWHVSPEAVKGDDAAAELVRCIRKIARGEGRLIAIEAEVLELRGGPLFGLKELTEEAERFERDMLAETTGRLDRDIEAAKQELAYLESIERPPKTS